MSESVYRAIELANSGHLYDALDILRDVTAADASQSTAWKWLAYLTIDPREAIYAARHVEQIDPNDPWLEQALPALTHQRLPRRSGRVRSVLNVAVGVVLFTLILVTAVQWLGILPRTGIAHIVSDQDPISLPSDARSGRADQQAAGAQQPAPADAAPASSTSDLSINVDTSDSTSYYSFSASTEDEIRQALYNDGPQLEDSSQAIAVTSYQMWVEWQGRQTVTGCQLTAGTVHLNVDYMLPRWVPDGAADAALYDEWDRFSEHVVSHEQRHAELAGQCASRLAEHLQAGGEQASCGDLEQWINEMVTEVYGYCEQIQTDFDAVNGRASFPLDPGS